MEPTAYNIVIAQGADFIFKFQIMSDEDSSIPRDLTNSSGITKIMSKDSAALVITENLIITDALNGKVEIKIPHTKTDKPTLNHEEDIYKIVYNYIYDTYLINSSGEKESILFGECAIRMSVIGIS